jgi:hypothetical protein
MSSLELVASLLVRMLCDTVGKRRARRIATDSSISLDMRSARLSILLLALAAPAASAQMSGMSGMHHHEDAARPVSAKTRRQIDSVARAVAKLGTRAAATNAGFRPEFGWIPTMGEHWVSRNLMMNGRQTNRALPSQLMFSKINGRDSLVGAAYAYVTADNDTVRPSLFDGSPAWHAHPDLAPPGLNLVMLHVWFVPSPNGIFAGTNPNLPFWAVGLAAPDSGKMRDPAFNARVRRASLAIAAVADTSSIFDQLDRRGEVHPVLTARRDTIRTLIADFRRAERARDAAAWDRAARKAAAQWDAIAASYLASAPTAEARRRMQEFISMLLGA